MRNRKYSSDTQHLLNHVYQGCQMGMCSVHQMVEKSYATSTQDMLLDLAHEHRRLMALAAEGLRPFRTAPRDINTYDRMRIAFLGKQLNPWHPEKRIGKGLVLGSRLALRSLMRYLRRYPLASRPTKKLVGELIELEKRTMREGLQLIKIADAV